MATRSPSWAPAPHHAHTRLSAALVPFSWFSFFFLKASCDPLDIHSALGFLPSRLLPMPSACPPPPSPPVVSRLQRAAGQAQKGVKNLVFTSIPKPGVVEGRHEGMLVAEGTRSWNTGACLGQGCRAACAPFIYSRIFPPILLSPSRTQTVIRCDGVLGNALSRMGLVAVWGFSAITI